MDDDVYHVVIALQPRPHDCFGFNGHGCHRAQGGGWLMKPLHNDSCCVTATALWATVTAPGDAICWRAAIAKMAGGFQQGRRIVVGEAGTPASYG